MRTLLSAVGLVAAMSMVPIRIIATQPSKDGEKCTIKAARHSDDWHLDAYGQNPTPFYSNPFTTPKSRAPFPYQPARAPYPSNDALFPGAATIGVYTAPGQISVFGIPPVNVQSTATKAPQVPQQATAGTGGSLAAGNYHLSVVAVDSSGGRSAPSTSVSLVVASAGGTGTIPNVVFDAGAATWELYAGTCQLNAYRVATGAVGSPVNFSSMTSTVTGGLYDMGQPDVMTDHFRVVITPIRHGGIWGAAASAIATNAITIPSTPTVNQWAGRVLSLYGSLTVPSSPPALYAGLSPAIPANFGVTANTTAGVMTVTQSTAPGGTPFTFPGDPYVMRAQANIASANTIGDSAFVNQFAPSGLAVNSERGAVVWIVAGKGKNQRASVLSNTSTTLTINGQWAITPDSTSTFVVVEPAPSIVIEGGAFQNSGVSVVDTALAAVKSLSYTSQGSQSFLVQVVTVDANGNPSPAYMAPYMEVFVPLPPVLVGQTAVNTTPYAVIDTDQVVSLQSGASVVNLPSQATARRQTLWIINTTSSAVTINAYSGETIEGSASLSLAPGARFQLMPGA